VRWVVVASLVAGCYPVEGNECDPGPYWDGPYLASPHAASIGERILVVWSEVLQEGGGVYRGTMTDGTTSDPPFDYEPTLKPRAAVSGLDRAMVTGEIDGGRSFYELRLSSGARVGSPVELDGYTRPCAFDGDAFLVTRLGGLIRIAPDGAAGPLIAIEVHQCAATDAVTWVMTGGADDPIRGSRIARGGGLLDASPRQILDDSYFWVTAAGPTETVVVSKNRDNKTTFVELRNDGTLGVSGPLVLESEFWRPVELIAERDGYLLVTEDTGSGMVHGMRIARGGALGPAFVLLDSAAGNTLSGVRTANASMLVYDQLPRRDEDPRIGAVRIADGALPGEPTTIVTVAGERYTVDCGCQTGRGTGGLLVLVVFLACRSRSRTRGSRSSPS
jgi:hypothetical protein